MPLEIAPKGGVAFELRAGQQLTVTDPCGEQVSDLLAFSREDIREVISSGRTIDYANTLYLTTGHSLYSNRSQPMLEIVADDVGRHDFTLTPCSRDTFRIIYGEQHPGGGCFENFVRTLAEYGIAADDIPVAFNCFMNVEYNNATGEMRVLPPLSRAGQSIRFRAAMDLIVALTACSALQSNNGSFKPIEYSID